jgi:hypothetical protein
MKADIKHTTARRGLTAAAEIEGNLSNFQSEPNNREGLFYYLNFRHYSGKEGNKEISLQPKKTCL